MFLKYQYKGNVYHVEIEKRDDEYHITYDGNVYTVTAREIEGGYLNINLGGRDIKAVVSRIEENKYVFYDGDVYEVIPVKPEGKKYRDEGTGEEELKSPISGRVVKVPVKEGDRVETGDVLMVIEAMKMEYIIRAPWAGTVEKVNFTEGQQIDIGRETMAVSKEE